MAILFDPDARYPTMSTSQRDATPEALRLKERRNDVEKRSIVERGVSAGQLNLIAGVEYLQSRDIEAGITMRVLCALLARRLSTQALHEPAAHFPGTSDA